VVAGICSKQGVRTALRSTHTVLEAGTVDLALAAAGVHVRIGRRGVMDGRALHEAAFTVDAGVTGGDYAIAETGTVVLHPRGGLSRLVSLAPPRHIAVVERGTVLPSLDELFVLERADLLQGNLAGSMNLISGPSRTGDIEGTIVYGIHGPLETHLVLVG
jgi:L-lactate dehydrogenase complex protein LldG